MLRVDHMTHLGGISPPDWKKMPCKRAGKLAGSKYLNLVPPDCASWLLDMEDDGPLIVFSASKGLLPMLIGRYPTFGEVLNWLKLAYTVE